MALSLFQRFRSSPHSSSKTDYEPLVQYAESHTLHLFQHVTLYHLNQCQNLPFLLFDHHRGIYLFDIVGWTYEEVKGVKASEARTADAPHKRDIHVDQAYRIVERKLAELAPHHQCDICKFLLLPHLTREEYDDLDASLKHLLPPSKLLFADESLEEIQIKLHHAIPPRDTALESQYILTPLFVQYSLLPDNLMSTPQLLTPDQQRYINEELPHRSLLCGGYGSGKSSLILAKALFLKLQYPEKQIAIITPSLVASELMMKRLIEMIDHAEVPVDPAGIRITTPYQIAKEHHLKLHKSPPIGPQTITPKMMRKGFFVADILFCDDIDALDATYIDYLLHLQKQKTFHATGHTPKAFDASEVFQLSQSFRSPEALYQNCLETFTPQCHESLHTFEGNAYIHTLHLLQRLLKEVDPQEILIIVPDPNFGDNLAEELGNFHGLDLQVFDTNQTLLNQNMEQLLLVCAGTLQGLQRRHVILIDDGNLNEAQQCLALSRTGEQAYLISHTPEVPHG